MVEKFLLTSSHKKILLLSDLHAMAFKGGHTGLKKFCIKFKINGIITKTDNNPQTNYIRKLLKPSITNSIPHHINPNIFKDHSLGYKLIWNMG